MPADDTVVGVDGQHRIRVQVGAGAWRRVEIGAGVAGAPVQEVELAAEWPRPRGTLRQRLDAAAGLLDELGALAYIEDGNGGFVLRSHGCLLAEAVHGRPEVCRSIESLVAELVQVPVRECCERGEHPRCCFRIGGDVAAAGVPRGTQQGGVA